MDVKKICFDMDGVLADFDCGIIELCGMRSKENRRTILMRRICLLLLLCICLMVCPGDQFISSKEQKEKILSDFGGLCCEMEGGAIAQVCYLADTPFVIIRAISDKADESESVNYEIFKKEAAANCASIVKCMVAKL